MRSNNKIGGMSRRSDNYSRRCCFFQSVVWLLSLSFSELCLCICWVARALFVLLPIYSGAPRPSLAFSRPQAFLFVTRCKWPLNFYCHALALTMPSVNWNFIHSVAFGVFDWDLRMYVRGMFPLRMLAWWLCEICRFRARIDVWMSVVTPSFIIKIYILHLLCLIK